MRIGDWEIDEEKGTAVRVEKHGNLEIHIQPSKSARREAERRLLQKGIISKDVSGKITYNG